MKSNMNVIVRLGICLKNNGSISFDLNFCVIIISHITNVVLILI